MAGFTRGVGLLSLADQGDKTGKIDRRQVGLGGEGDGERRQGQVNLD
jgi:hypothetical protein